MGITIWAWVGRALGFIDPARKRDVVAPTVDRMSVRFASMDQPVGQLSGGNQQKISVAKWVASDVDVRTKEDMYAVIESLKALGKAVLVISSGLAEIVRISDRIAVMANKRIVWGRPDPGDYESVSQVIMLGLT